MDTLNGDFLSLVFRDSKGRLVCDTDVLLRALVSKRSCCLAAADDDLLLAAPDPLATLVNMIKFLQFCISLASFALVYDDI